MGVLRWLSAVADCHSHKKPASNDVFVSRNTQRERARQKQEKNEGNVIATCRKSSNPAAGVFLQSPKFAEDVGAPAGVPSLSRFLRRSFSHRLRLTENGKEFERQRMVVVREVLRPSFLRSGAGDELRSTLEVVLLVAPVRTRRNGREIKMASRVVEDRDRGKFSGVGCNVTSVLLSRQVGDVSH